MCVYVLGFHLNCILIVDCSQNSLINPALGKRLLFISFIHRIQHRVWNKSDSHVTKKRHPEISCLIYDTDSKCDTGSKKGETVLRNNLVK